MVIFHSYVKLPEGIPYLSKISNLTYALMHIFFTLGYMPTLMGKMLWAFRWWNPSQIPSPMYIVRIIYVYTSTILYTYMIYIYNIYIYMMCIYIYILYIYHVYTECMDVYPLQYTFCNTVLYLVIHPSVTGARPVTCRAPHHSFWCGRRNRRGPASWGGSMIMWIPSGYLT